MAKKAHVLFLLFEGLADTVIDSQVLSHVDVMQRNDVATFEIWAFACDDENYEKSCIKKEHAERLSGAKVRIFKGYRPSKLFALKKNARLLEQALKDRPQTFSHIHARTEYSAAVASRLSQINFYRLIWDCRGDAIAELDYRYKDGSIKSKLMKTLRTYVFTQRLKIAGKACDAALFVSAPLKEVMKPYIGEKATGIFPCCASKSLFFYDGNLRQEIRASLSLNEDQNLYTYSGSLAPYQRFEETVEHFQKIAEQDTQAILLVLTPDVRKAKLILEEKVLAHYILKHVQFNEINGYLNASDAAFMLRDSTPTNRVATPTKFAEYCLTGLPVIMSDAVKACFLMANEVGNLIDEKDQTKLGELTSFDRDKIASSYHPKLSREGQVACYKKIYSVTK